MDLVDEKDDVAAGANFFEHFLEALFEITAITATSHKGTEVKCVELFVGQRFGHFVGHDALSKAFNDGCLADARFTDEHRVVFCAPRKNLHDAFHLALSTDDWVKLLVARQLGEVAAELIKNLAATFFARRFFGTNRFALTFAASTFVTAQ